MKHIVSTHSKPRRFLLPVFILLCASGLLATPGYSETQSANPEKPATVADVKPLVHHGYTAIYQAAYKGLPLQATHRLERAGSDWFFSSIASGFFGQIEENSTFAYTDSSLIPKHYTYSRSVLGHDNENELLYNPEDKLVVSSNKTKTWKMPLAGGELDQGTYVLALRDDVARGLQEMCYNVVEEDEIDHYCFRVTGKETLDTALGNIDTVVVERVRKAESPRRTRFWLAPSLNYCIARLEHREKEQTAYSLEITYYKKDASK